MVKIKYLIYKTKILCSTLEKTKKKAFPHYFSNSGIFYLLMHHRMRKCDPKFEIFCSEVFSTFIGCVNEISDAYHENSLLHIRKDQKKPVSPLFLITLMFLPTTKENKMYLFRRLRTICSQFVD